MASEIRMLTPNGEGFVLFREKNKRDTCGRIEIIFEKQAKGYVVWRVRSDI